MSGVNLKRGKTLHKLILGMAKILNEEEELADYNFTIDILAKTARVHRSTIYDVMDSYLDLIPDASNKKKSVWCIMDIADILIRGDFERRLEIQKNKKVPADTLKDFFYAMTVTIFTHKEYLTALYKHYGKCKPIADMLKSDEPMLWEIYLKDNGKQKDSTRELFSDVYGRLCLRLEKILARWVRAYGCDESYCEYYAESLADVAKLFVAGVDVADKLRQILENEPIVSIEPWYVSREWERMTSKILKEKELIKREWDR